MSPAHRRAPAAAPGARSRAKRAASETPESPSDDEPANAGATWLAGLAAGDLARMLALGVDVCMLVDTHGVVRACHGADDDALVQMLAGGCGLPLIDLVERESRSDVRRLLAAARAGRHSLRHRIVHRVAVGNVVAMTYRSLAVGTGGDVAVLGHRTDDPRTNAPHVTSAERAYAELFSASTAPYVLLGIDDDRVLDANPAARAWLANGRGIIGSALPRLFAPRHRAALAAWLALRDAPPLCLEETPATIELRVFARGGEHGTLRVVELRRTDPGMPGVAPPESIPAPLVFTEDAVALCDAQGLLCWANPAFLEAFALAPQAAVRLQPLATLAPPLAAAMDALVRGAAPPLRSVILDDGRKATLDALRLSDRDGATIALVLRTPALDVSNPFAPGANLAALIGTTPLKSMVRDSAEQVERMCIESTLKLTGNNRSLAARVLGMSRQGLYLKLRQYGLLEENDGDAPVREQGESGGQ